MKIVNDDNLKHDFCAALNIDVSEIKALHTYSRSGYKGVYFEAGLQRHNWTAKYFKFDRERTKKLGGQSKTHAHSICHRIGRYPHPFFAACAMVLSQKHESFSTIESDVKSVMHSFDENQLAIDTTGDKATEFISDLLPLPNGSPVPDSSPYVSSNMHLSDRDQLTSDTTGDKETESMSDFPPLSDVSSGLRPSSCVSFNTITNLCDADLNFFNTIGDDVDSRSESDTSITDAMSDDDMSES